MRTNTMRKRICLKYNLRNKAVANRNEWFEKYGIYKKDEYTLQSYFDKITPGAPIIINILGTYYYLDRLFDIVDSGSYKSLCEYVRMVKTADNSDDGDFFYFWWV